MIHLSAPGRRGRQRVAAAVLSALLTATLAGCATLSGGVEGDIARSMSDVASAAQSAVIVVDQYEDDATTAPVAATTLDDMLDAIETANTAVAELDVRTGDEAGLRDEAAAVIRDCVDAVNAVRARLAGLDLPDAAADLKDAADRASALRDALEPSA